eukprot:Tamp_21511.p1 GENE.Tamp_21511~~Tamp_21511.p1  ORF type:complete len:353 (+),score=57.18 Tamp_21511:155-1060(+)
MGGRLPYIREEDMTPAEFSARFLLPNRPCMVTGCAETWRAGSRWSSSAAFCEFYGHVELRVTEVQQAAHPFQEPQCRAVRVPMRHYVPYARQNCADYPWYAFDDDFSETRAELLQDFAPPPFFHADCYSVAPQVRANVFPKNTFFVVGGARSGTVMHADPHYTSAWNTLLCGRKRWILLPPTEDVDTLRQMGVDPSYRTKGPPTQWWADEYPKMVASGIARELGAIEVVQEAGDTIYVPMGWWHTVLNLEFSVAVTANFLQHRLVRDFLFLFLFFLHSRTTCNTCCLAYLQRVRKKAFCAT